MIVAFIREHRDRREPGGLRWGVQPICDVLTEHGLPMAPSTYYDQLHAVPSARQVRDDQLKIHITRVHEENFGVYGVRKVWLQLNREQIPVARCTVARLMRALGLRGVTRGKVKRTTISDPAADRPADLVARNFHPAAPNRLWVADLTYVSTWSGWVYVAFVVDAYARRILGWRTATTMTTGIVLDALEQAIWTRRREGHADLSGLVHHSDRGSQYSSLRFGERLVEAGIAPSVGTVGRQLRQRPRRDNQRPLQDRVDQARQALANRRGGRTRHRRMDRLVQPPPPLRVLRRHSTRRTGDRSLCSTTSTANRCAVTPMSLRTSRCGSVRSVELRGLEP